MQVSETLVDEHVIDPAGQIIVHPLLESNEYPGLHADATVKDEHAAAFLPQV